MIGVLTGFRGSLYGWFDSRLLRKPADFYNCKKSLWVRLFKPHGSINWISENGNEYLTNDYEILRQKTDCIEIVTPDSFQKNVLILARDVKPEILDKARKRRNITVFYREGSNSDEKLIGILTKVMKKRIESSEDAEGDEEAFYSNNCCVINLVGSFYNKYGAGKESKFKRAINTYPEINSKVYWANESAMQMIMRAVSNKKAEGKDLEIGHFASNRDVSAILDGNRFFQRHACIVGSTGSGKSYTVASVLEKANRLPYANMIVFDLHGEYNSLFAEASEGTSANQRAVVIKGVIL